MQKFQTAITSPTGDIIPNAVITILTSTGSTPIIYAGNGVNPYPTNQVTTNSQGEFSFYAANGRYSYTVAATNYVTEAYTDFLLFDPADAPSGTYSIDTEYQLATAGQTVITLTQITYIPGSNNLSVYVNGARLTVNVDYAETSSTQVTFTNAFALNDEVVCVAGAEISQAVDSANVGFLQAGTGAVSRTTQSKLRDTVSVKDFGAVGDGVTDDRAAIQAAINAMFVAGGGTVYIPQPSVYYRIRLALQAKSGVTIEVQNNATRIVCTADGAGAKWPIYGIICYGGYTGVNYNRAPVYLANAVTRGNESITLTTTSESSNFSVGDVISIETVSNYTVGADIIPTWLQLNVVTASAGGVVSLRRPINQTQANVKLRQLTTNLTFLNADGTDSGYPMQAVRDFTIIGGTWENTDPVAPFMGDGGAIDCVIKPNKTVAGEGCAYGNLFAYCKLGENTAILSRNAVELAFGSHDNVVEIDNISINDNYTVGDPDRIIGLNEGAHDNVVQIGGIDIGASSPQDIIQVFNAYRNNVSVGTINGVSATGAVATINYLAYTGTPNNSYDNIIQIGASNVGTQLRYVQLGSLNTYRSYVQGNFYGTVTSDAISVTSPNNVVEGYFQNGALAETSDSSSNIFNGQIGTGRAFASDYDRVFYNNYTTTTTSFNVFRSLGYILSPATYTSASGLSKTTTFPAGTLITGDILRFELRGRCTGAAGTKTLQLAFGGTTFLDLSGGAAIPAGTQGVFVSAELYVASNTVVVGHVIYTIGATTTQVDIGITGLNLTTTAYNFVQTISVAAAVDTFTSRQSRLFCHRPFVNNTPW